MRDLYGLVIWIESILNQSIILIECAVILMINVSGYCWPSERTIRMAVCQPTGGKNSHILT